MRKNRPWLYSLFWIVVSFLTLFPIYWLFVISVKPAVDLFSTPDILIKSFYWQNYIDVLNDRTLRGYMVNSLVISTGNAVLCTVLGFFACYALSRFDMGGKESIFFWTITNRMAPPAVFLLPLFLLMTQVYRIGDFSLLDTRIGMILVYCTFNLPFAIWTLRPTVDGIPKELDEAAYVDGASPWKVITEVVLPLARPGLAVTLILTWVFAWNEYLLAATLTNFNARTLTTGLSEYVTTTGTEWGIMAAISVFTLIPALIVFGLVQKHIVAGLTFGAVKG
ncbi:carbohydrate ABC transporter permease [Salipiger marinus]|jgi:ABC-type glycerol-3-phosphate transport system permease component|uniref:Carbohydrate ABC transporter membrane protein 2, CUT1 family n=1 Tax=Salipiger marinus TaxID=555512 RepID=A0A1G8LYE0_9RHOB|nr:MULTISPECIES: carbohydrate ABC transporter permease [Salipiger]HBM61983.1 carbohydrate ABC transporter permease [Citreicella sp.]MCD1619082.1 carbohydrate ABC transporter permease [Salipiger manganoxidans]MEB3420155.1 carbohydrate ABC transporter permease [Salipiger manganoxidans]SDI60752.1 carbohydrate ABC transporter membrane protein 2, CUT1 family [Salipiger marinus]HBT01430.1 carbohydrate ABC transporter permease [Citreicella sp.]